nr:trypsin-like peptidase domain-containing protein [Pleionea sp. CnH1-48]
MVEDVKDSVVVITARFDSEYQDSGTSFGSGFVIDDDGYILTNRHVVYQTYYGRQGDKQATFIRVKLGNGKEYDAEVVGADIGTDLALLKIDAPKLKEVKVADIDEVKVGAWVVAFGAPLGLEKTITAGIVSAKNRSLPGAEQYVPFLQTDAAINFGNSGGPLFNVDGEVIGINSRIKSARGSGNIGLAFAIPINLGVHIAGQLKEYGHIKRGYLGVEYQDLDHDLARNFGLSKVTGAILKSVAAGSPADKAGLEPSDVVTHINGKEVTQAGDLPYLIGLLEPGKEIDVKIIRGKKKKTIEVVLGEREQRAVSSSGRDSSQGGLLGLAVREIPDRYREAAQLDSGVFVQEVYSGPANRGGIEKGDVILRVGSEVVKSVEHFEKLVEAKKDDGDLALLVFRRGQTQYLAISLK